MSDMTDDDTLARLAKDIAAAVVRGESGVDLVKLAVGWEREAGAKIAEDAAAGNRRYAGREPEMGRRADECDRIAAAIRARAAT